ncbi:hypothetical protein [Haloarcula sp. JP-L23]|uniref:hypothetical protein n=1 Tax=Haloarcula sp. JP-L23 TaxID=2716717 RepID=UPI00140F455C|nr:hypothetical protein G9465_08650 [Haloarcula sp. JP-L23]
MTGADVPAGDVLAETFGVDPGAAVERGQQDRDAETGEAFGGQGVVERGFRDVLNSYEDAVVDPAADTAGDVGRFVNDPSARPGFLQPVTQPGQDPEDVTTGVGIPNEAQAEAAVRTVGNLPRLGLTPIEAGEFVVEGAEAAATGEGGEFVERAGGAAAVTAAEMGVAAQQSPDRFLSTLGASTLGTAGILRGARAAGGARGARAAATTIQPGEELAIAAARRGVPGTSRLAGAIGDVDVRRRAGEFRRDESGQLGRSRAGESDGSSGSGGSSDTTPTISAEDLSGSRATVDPTRGGRFGTRPTGGRSPESRPERIAEGEPGAGNVRGFRSAETEQQRGGVAADRGRVPDNDLRERAQRPEVRPAGGPPSPREALFGAVRTEATTDTATDAQQRTEAAQEAEVRPGAGVGAGVGLGLRPDVDVGPAEVERARVEPFAGLRSEPLAGTRGETRQDTRQDTRTETRTETRFDTRKDTRSESRQETRAEARAEARREPLADPVRGGRGDDDEERSGFLGTVDEIRTEFRNPLTGDVLQGGSGDATPTPDGPETGLQLPGLSGFPGFEG